jgi:hypothetical protein
MGTNRIMPRRWTVTLTALVLVASACSGFLGTADDDPNNAGEQVFVEPDRASDVLTINISLTDEGLDPATIFLPAGQHIKLVLRNRGDLEHHYRVAGLIPSDMAWLLTPEVDEAELEMMSPEELEALDIDLAVDDPEHTVHHLNPVFVPFRHESPSGIKPLANEVHGYATRGTTEILDFFPTNVGTFVVEDVLHPEITGKVVVFDASAAAAGSGG